jgi:hypothetical protein
MAGEPERWPAMGAESRRRALAHGLDEVLRGYEEIYQRVLSARRPGIAAGF